MLLHPSCAAAICGQPLGMTVSARTAAPGADAAGRWLGNARALFCEPFKSRDVQSACWLFSSVTRQFDNSRA